ncbi:MAG TPA: hypothetical protein VE958_16605 [Bryobacteraceae bacterium]|nr:hypothetical protein [Bryobacteraceae bacterium]
MRLILAALIGVGSAMAQQAVPTAREPHHHIIYEDVRVRILSAEVEARGATLLHRHDADYVWVALGDVKLADTVPGRPETRIQASNASVHFSRGGFSHVTRNESDTPFHIVAVDLLQRQTNPHNVCGGVLPGEYEHCREPGSEWLGANLAIQFETDQTHIGILQIAPNSTLAIPPADVPPLLIALEGTEAEAVSRVNGASVASGSRRPVKAADVLRWPADQVSQIRNLGKNTARFLVVEFGGPGE